MWKFLCEVCTGRVVVSDAWGRAECHDIGSEHLTSSIRNVPSVLMDDGAIMCPCRIHGAKVVDDDIENASLSRVPHIRPVLDLQQQQELK